MRERGVGEATGDLSSNGKPFSFSNQLLHLSGHNLFACRERERACARSFSSWTTFFPVAKEQEMVEEAVDDARSVC